MTLIEHLEELRSRLIISMGSVAVGAAEAHGVALVFG